MPGGVPGRQAGLDLPAGHGDGPRTPLLGQQRRLDGAGIDAVGVDDDEEVTARQPVVVKHRAREARCALDTHAAQGAAAKHDAVVEHGVDRHQAARPEEDLLGAQRRVPTGAEHVQKSPLLDRVGDLPCGRGYGVGLLGHDPLHEAGYGREVLLAEFSNGQCHHLHPRCRK